MSTMKHSKTFPEALYDKKTGMVMLYTFFVTWIIVLDERDNKRFTSIANYQHCAMEKSLEFVDSGQKSSKSAS